MSMLSRLNEWCKNNGSGVTIVAAGLFLVVMVGCGGFNLDRWVTVPVPTELQRALILPARIPLADANRAFQSYMLAGKQFAKDIQGANEFLGAVEGLFSLAFAAGSSAVPGVGGLMLTFLGGLMIKGPGTGKEKEKSYKKGRQEMESILLPLLREAGIKIPTGETT